MQKELRSGKFLVRQSEEEVKDFQLFCADCCTANASRDWRKSYQIRDFSAVSKPRDSVHEWVLGKAVKMMLK